MIVASTSSKRAADLFQPTETIVIDGNSPVSTPKKLRLRNFSLLVDIVTNMMKCNPGSREIFTSLIRISEDVRFIEENPTDILEAMQILSEIYRRENDNSTFRMKILSIFADCSKNSDNRVATSMIDEIINLLRHESSFKVISQGLYTLYKIGLAQENLPVSYNTKIVLYAQKQLTSNSQGCQRQSLLVLGYFASLQEADKGIIDQISHYTDSPDSSVRAQAIRSLLTLGKRGAHLDASLFERANKSLQDDYECVRKEALNLIFTLGVKHSEHVLENEENETSLRMVDSAFGKICGALSDVAMPIRTQAAELLGNMTMVSPEFLHQTLDKKLMSNLRRKKSLHERSSQHFASGEWASGKKWADDAPKEFVDTNSVSLIASGSCGALVHGLEDEFLEVRSAAVDSMCKLALSNSEFAIMCLDFLVDMFNDEIEDVRLKAIYSLTAISRHILLREDQLEIMLSSLEDFSVDVREGLHLMLGACKVSTQSCLLMVVQKLLDVLSKYPQDKQSAFRCFRKIGLKHGELCMALTSHFLRDHPFFDSAERDVEDPSYICLLIMLFNAAYTMVPIISLFPDVTLKHYDYLRDAMPDLVPNLPIESSARNIVLRSENTGSTEFLETVLSNLSTTFKSSSTRTQILKVALDNLNRMSEIDPEMFGIANFLVTFLSAQLLIEQLQVFATQRSRNPLKDSLSQLVKHCLKLQNLFSGLTETDMLLVKQLSLRASALQLVLVVKDRSQSALAPCQLLLNVASDIRSFLYQRKVPLPIQPDSFTTSILDQLSSINDPKPGRVFREILPLIQKAPPMVNPQSNINIQMCVARIIEPVTSLDNVLKVTAGLIAALAFYAEIDNLNESQIRDIRVKIKYPDQNVHTTLPKVSDFKNVMTENGPMDNYWKLRTTILLSHSVWTESSSVEIALCLSVRPGTELELCKPVKVQFAPKPVRRGI